ncbi:unnamed protein product [Phytophthora lilii]|uniref:Unnamed protein product n=1 Tax=Phytophthora lilii TaxID=2077276 RepID=A0A9W6TNZ1_9STRA|nr:unnamed protein product [Phytophthora lilii]
MGVGASFEAHRSTPKFPKQYCRIIKRYMPHFPITEPSNNEDRLYLFEHYPHMKPLFQASVQIQSRVIVHISSGMKSLLSSEDLVQKVMNLALVHLKIGVKPEDFDPLGDSLIQAMRLTCGDDWNERIESAWTRIYCHASILILVNIPDLDLSGSDDN